MADDFDGWLRAHRLRRACVIRNSFSRDETVSFN
jgi:hypothetical protein